jgi:exopolysaccharide production protein ExoQ
VSPAIATLLCCVGIIGIFWLDRDPKSRTSPALWIPVLWFLLACSRTPARWLFLGQAGAMADDLVDGLDGHPINRVVYTALLVLALIVLLKRREQVVSGLRNSWPILLFFIYCLVSLMWSDYPQVAFRRWNKAIGDWLMVLIVWTDPQPITALKRLLARTAYVLVPLSILFIRYYPEIGRYYHRWLGTTFFSGVAVEKNGLGAICLVFGLGTVWRLLNLFTGDHQDMQRGRRLIAQGVILAMILWLFSIANSVTSLVCLLMGTCLLVATRFRVFTKSRFMVHCFVLLIILLPASVAFLDLSPDALHAVGRNSTLTERTDIWAGVIKLNPNSWVGAGYESFWLGPRLQAMVSDVTREWVPNQSHNGYLEIWVNLGWIGLGCLAVVLFYGYKRVFLAWRHNVPAGDLMLAYFVTGVNYNISEAAFFRATFPVWLFFLLAIAVLQDTGEQSSRESITSNELEAGRKGGFRAGCGGVRASDPVKAVLQYR